MSLKNLFFLANEGSGDLTSPLLGDKLKLPANMYLAASIIAGVIITLIGGLIFLRLPLEIMPKFLLFDAPIFFYLLIGIVVFIFSVSGRIFNTMEELKMIIIISAGLGGLIFLLMLLGVEGGTVVMIIVAVVIGGAKGVARQDYIYALAGAVGGIVGGIVASLITSGGLMGGVVDLLLATALVWGGIIAAEEYLTPIIVKQAKSKE